ncbi:hypothetical protein HUU40_07430 [candidate division KSB1 bacterium]|nr:hypothetical protein [candidate division KSB1 bacterium]
MDDHKRKTIRRHLALLTLALLAILVILAIVFPVEQETPSRPTTQNEAQP